MNTASKKKEKYSTKTKNGQKSNVFLTNSSTLHLHNTHATHSRSSLLSHPATLSPLIHRFPNRENPYRKTKLVQTRTTHLRIPCVENQPNLALPPNRFYNKVRKKRILLYRFDTLQGSKIGDKHVGGRQEGGNRICRRESLSKVGDDFPSILVHRVRFRSAAPADG